METTIQSIQRWIGKNPVMVAIMLAYVACTLLGVVWASGAFGTAPREEMVIPASMDAMGELSSNLIAV